MTDYLREIFENNYEPRASHHPMRREGVEAWDKAAAILDDETITEMILASGGVSLEEQLDCFRLGFRLGASLMLEVFQG